VHVVVVSLNHRTAPVDVRERFAIRDDALPAALRELMRTSGILEGVILSTCNRTEIYGVVGRLQMCVSYVREFMERYYGVPASSFTRHLQVEEDEEAVRHLFRVACGLDSMVLGETQILGQVKNAYFAAQRERATGTIFNRLFHQAITLAKRAHAETKINDHAVSVARAACQLAERHIGSLEGRHAVLVGAGRTAELALRHLKGRGIGRITVANRTVERARQLARQVPDGDACSLDELPALIAREQPDLVISATASPGFVLTRDQLAGAREGRAGTLVLVDIAVPRDLDPAIGELANTRLFGIDDLREVLDDHLDSRRRLAELVGAMIDAELASYREWYRLLGIGPVIRALQERARAVHEQTMDSLLRKLPDLSEREVKVIRKLTKSIANRMLTDPVNRIKELAAGPGGREAVELFVRIFALEGALAESGLSFAGMEGEPDGKADAAGRAEPFARRTDTVALGAGPSRP